jgi:bifunctional diaminopimelate decarboxylase / aspartate kinase
MWEVYKFGGTSITKKGFDKINNIIDSRNYKIVIILSAISNVTNLLFQLVKQKDITIFNDIKQIHVDLMNKLSIKNKIIIHDKINDLHKMVFNNKTDTEDIIAYGEILSTLILNEYLKKKTFLIDSRHIIKHTNGKFNCIKKNFINVINDNEVIIMQGFIASYDNNKTCILSRGGSDTTATLIANMLDVKNVYIYTDVDGIYTSDPNKIKNASIIQHLDYEVAQELAATGGKVLHPFSIKPAQEKNINIYIRNTYNENSGTIINNLKTNNFSVINQKNIVIFHIKSVNMWNNYGFVHDIFKDFSEYGINVNIITTSQFEVSCTTDGISEKKLLDLYNKLSKRYQVKIIKNSNMISVVGNNITLNNDFMEKLFLVVKKYKIHITHYSSNNLSISFIVENESADNLNNDIHDIIVFNYDNWWKIYTNYFINTIKNKEKDSVYFYNLKTINKKCELIKKKLNKIDQFYYAMKANSNFEVLKEITKQGIGLECVSKNEIILALKFTNNIIFTPNFCDISEYEFAFANNVKVIVDNINILTYPIFKNKKYGLRLDPHEGDGHHQKVVTSGNNSKFGINLEDLEDLDKSNIIGLHCHKGSGITNPKLWDNTVQFLLKLAPDFPNLEWIDIGGGLGVDLDLDETNKFINLENKNNIKIFIEPGRYFVSSAGVLVSKVTQTKTKCNINYMGISTGMNSLIRPTLYNAYHKIHNISSSYNREIKEYTIVGPICESGDILGEKRLLPETFIGDFILIENCGAYGFTMSSNYNLREPAEEFTIKY